MTTTLAACMRNEGIFVLEWLTHQHALGFGEVIVGINNRAPQKDPGMPETARQSEVPGQARDGGPR